MTRMRACTLTTLIDLISLVSHLVAHVLEQALACTFLTNHSIKILSNFHLLSKDPHYVLGQCLDYMITLNDYVLWYLGLTFGCLIYNEGMCEE